MTASPLPASDDEAGLRACLRDLVGLLGLPALWSGRDIPATVRLLTETLVETLSLDACWVTTARLLQEESFGYLYANGKPVEAAQAEAWASFTAQASPRHLDLELSQELTPLGELRIARFSLAYYGYQGQVTVGSTRRDFPKPTELILLRSAASLASSGLRTAQLAYERERALRAKDEFLAMLGHELRNPLAPIVAALDLMRLKGNGVLTAEQTIISRQVKHLVVLVDDLLDVTRITQGKIELKRELLEVRSILDAAIETAQPLIEGRKHALSCDVPETSLLVNGDARRLTQVVSNLLINSAKYTDPGGRLSLTAVQAGDHVAITIEDNGIGIDSSLMPHIFELFQQGTVDTARSRGGLGIGLSVVKALVAMHGGTVTPESRGKGLGSSFTVRLPLAQPTAPATTSAPQRGTFPVQQRASRILVIDDNQDAADLLSELLRALGHEVHVAYAPLKALPLCREICPEIVVLDIGLPGLSGYELAEMIRAQMGANAPRIIALTGYGQQQDRARSQQAGIAAHLTKPVSIEALITHLQTSSPV